MEIGGFNQCTSLSNLETGDRGINPSGEKKHGLSVCPERHAGQSGDDFSVDIDELSDFDTQFDIRFMHIHLCVRKSLQNTVAEFLLNFRRGHGICLFRTSRFDFEADRGITVCGTKIREDRLFQDGKILRIGELYHRGDAGNSKDMTERINAFLVVVMFRFHMDVDSAPFSRDGILSAGPFQFHADIFCQGVFKDIAILSFCADFRVLN